MMNYKSLEKLLLNRPGAYLDFPFGPQAAVFKVAQKMYALVGIEEDPISLSLKCDPEEAEGLRAIFSAIKPAYHMNKEHWNTIILDGSLPEGLIPRMIEASYDLVVQKLKKAVREALEKGMEIK